MTSYLYGPGGEPLEQITGSTTTYLHHDQLGSIRLITDSSGSTSTATTLSYDPYGNAVSSSGPLTSDFGFAGQYLDAETGFLYLRARYYDPATGQFLSRDPLVATTRSPYGYVEGNPLNSVDPSGLDNCRWFSWLCDGIATGAQAVGNAGLTVVEAPVAVAQSVILNGESLVSEPYGVYRVGYAVNQNSNIPGVSQVMSGVQRAGLWGDKVIDTVQQCTGYPGATVNDEGQPVHIAPSIIYPTFGAGWWKWQQNKFSWGPTASGPGVNPNGSEDYSDH